MFSQPCKTNVISKYSQIFIFQNLLLLEPQKHVSYHLQDMNKSKSQKEIWARQWYYSVKFVCILRKGQTRVPKRTTNNGSVVCFIPHAWFDSIFSLKNLHKLHPIWKPRIGWNQSKLNPKAFAILNKSITFSSSAWLYQSLDPGLLLSLLFRWWSCTKSNLLLLHQR